jgi:peptide deformylase
MKLSKASLYKKATTWNTWDTKTNLEIANQMVSFMQAKNGIGLAANQVGFTKRLFVMNVDGIIRFCFNPTIISASQEQCEMVEGCLSFPGSSIEITRPATIEVRYQDCSGEFLFESLSGLAARCFQHEYDHLNGITMLKYSNT